MPKIQSPVSQKIFVQEKNKNETMKRNLSRSITALLAASQICFGLNFGFSKIVNVRYKTAIQCITSIMGCVMMLSLPLGFAVHEVKLWMTIYFIQYIPTFFILLSAKYTLCEFLTDLTHMKELPERVHYKKLGPMAWTTTTIVFIIKFTTAALYCSHTSCTDSRQSLINFMMHIPVIGLDIIPVANFLLFFYVHAMMKHLKISLERREINLDTLLMTYKELADSFDKLRSSHDAIFVWGFLTNSPKWMIMIWNHIILMKSSNSWLLYSCSCAWAGLATLELCAPAVLAEAVAAQCDAVDGTLHERILMEMDGAKSLELSRVLRYMRARPLLAAAWRLLPLGLRPPVAALCASTTYLVVLIQFTHLFD